MSIQPPLKQFKVEATDKAASELMPELREFVRFLARVMAKRDYTALLQDSDRALDDGSESEAP